MEISKTDDVIQFDGSNHEEVIAHSGDLLTTMVSVDGDVLIYNSSTTGIPEATVLNTGDWVGTKGIYTSLEGFDYELPEDEADDSASNPND